MSSTEGWVVLHHDQTGVPNLLAKFTASDAGYDIAITDLTSVWRETLSYGQILRRAEDDSCSISPSDDLEQLRILLCKIKEALTHIEGAFVKVEGKDDSDDLIVTAIAPLPKPLAPFSWRIHVERADPTELTTAIVSPTLRLAYQQQQEIRYLSDQLHRKDHVIGKLLDRMESANVHLDSVFPLPNIKFSKKIPQRDQFAKHVPGLSVFQPGIEHTQADCLPSSRQLCNILEKVPSEHAALTVPRNGWWRTMNNASQANIDLKLKAEYSLDLDDDATDEDDFQTQELPQHLKVTGSTALAPPPQSSITDANLTRHAIADVETTDDEEALVQLPRSERILSPPRIISDQSQPPSRRLGKIGRARSRQPVMSPDISRANDTPSPARTSRTTMSPILTVEVPSSISALPVKRKIGTIGGRRGSSQPSNQPLRDTFPSVPPSIQEQTSPSLLVPAENRNDLTEPSSPTMVTGRSRLCKHENGEEQPAQPRETSEERANLKRDMLKKELETKKAPAKKKRKF